MLYKFPISIYLSISLSIGVNQRSVLEQTLWFIIVWLSWFSTLRNRTNFILF